MLTTRPMTKVSKWLEGPYFFSGQPSRMGKLLKYGVPLGPLALIVAVLVSEAATSAINAPPRWDGFNRNILKFSQNGRPAASSSVTSSDAQVPRFVLVIEVTKALHYTSPRYMSVTISGGQMSRGLEGFDFKLKKLRNLAAALAPSYVRFGGTLADFVVFDPSGEDSSAQDRVGRDTENTENMEDTEPLTEEAFDLEEEFEEKELEEMPRDLFGLDISARRATRVDKKKKHKHFTITGSRWDNITRFCDSVGWDIMWDFNLLHFKRGRWDPQFARKFLKYSTSRGVRIPAFQLGNEPNLYKSKFGVDIDGRQLAQDFWLLKDVISELPQYSASGLYGPDVTNLDQHRSARTYLTQFLKNQGCDAVTEVSLHHYYLKGEVATLKDFVDPRVMEGLRTQLEYAYNISWENCRVHKPVRLTETSTATGGGIDGVTDAFVAGFLWLDKLGLSATFGVTHVFRQTFFASSYALISRDLEPNPDYYLSVMYKRLVEGPVFKVITEGLSPLVRIYAHCVSKRYYQYPDGALVVYYLNMGSEQSRLSASQFQSTDSNSEDQIDLFVFTPGDSQGLLSRKIKLNGKVLEMNGSEVPKMDAQMHSGDVPLNPRSFGFVVIPYADVPLCKYYHRTENL
ncbi:hypothetical protein RRG08_028578 [Elysia crispata]|uniref:Heparanase n=1 Tax=Elysia crispata TaxID=231223 RepID=A0AAE0Y9M2_9GAST|nr:hypothetical protein RRG08_028578 [Elysia crispata]